MSSLASLVEQGILQIGEQLVWHRRSLKTSYAAVVNKDGTITLSNGSVHRTPSGAARALNNKKPIDGWLAWKVVRTGKSLNEHRSFK